MIYALHVVRYYLIAKLSALSKLVSRRDFKLIYDIAPKEIIVYPIFLDKKAF